MVFLIFLGYFWSKVYGRFLEMPQKVCGGDILHVMAFAKIFEMPQNRTVSVFFLFEI